MTHIEAIHPPPNRLSAYAHGRLDGPEMDEIEQHLSSCISCCQWIRDQPEDSLIARLRGRSTAMVAAPVTEQESAVEPPSDFQIPSSFVVGPAASPAPHDETTLGGPPSDPPALIGLPQELNDHLRYRVVSTLGAGGMGTVYRAEHRLMDRPVALKVIRADLLGSAALVERFRREVKSAARLASHPNIVAAYDAEQAGETHMLVMEFIEGTDLARLVDRRGPLPVGEACEYARQAVLGLQHACEDGMVHRDIKPQNLMRTTRGQVKILDFGLARFASEVGSHAAVTAEGMVLGSADYIAPEQIDDPHAADIRADIYSLGCTLYFLLAGRPPFPDGSLIQKLLAHSKKTPRQLPEVRADVPPELARVVERMMAKNPADRFQTPDEVGRALAPFADAEAAGAAAPILDAPTFADAPTPFTASSSLASTVGDQKPSGQATRSGSSPRRPWVRIAVALAMLLIVASFLALITYRIQTPTGELIIESDDPNIEVIVKQGGQQVNIIDPNTKDRIELKAGQYELQLAGGDGLKLSTDTFTLKRGDKTVVTVRREPPVSVPPLKPASKVARPDADPAVKTASSQGSIENSIGMTLKLIPAGEFMMGSPDDDRTASNHEKPQHRVRITRPLYLGIHEVTQAQYEAVLGSNPSWFSAKGGGAAGLAGQSTDQNPVENVTWLDTVNFCNKLSEKEGLKPFYEVDGETVRVPDWRGPGYRLPTEAEWEYACRANSKTPYSFGAAPTGLDEHGWYDGNSGGQTHPVGQKRSNAFGLFDMHGNVWEWCWDEYGELSYQESPVDDPRGPAGAAAARVIRGGSGVVVSEYWISALRYARSACRVRCRSEGQASYLGFRVARVPSAR